MNQKNNIVFLSYSLSNNTPLYGNGEGIHFSKDKEIDKGDSCNTMNLSLPNHSGTHIDFQYHFIPKGKTIDYYPADFWQFENIEIINLTGKISDCQIIGPEIFPDLRNPHADLLLLITGYGKYRGTDRYTLTPPGLSSKLSPFIRMNFPKLRCLGMDIISVSSYSNRQEGHKAHHSFLNPEIGDPILLIEDMKLDNIVALNKVIVAPLLIESADGTPCTILGYKK